MRKSDELLHVQFRVRIYQRSNSFKPNNSLEFRVVL